MLVQPYLNFDGRCEEAINFYKTTLGAESIMLMRYSETPDPTPPGSTSRKNRGDNRAWKNRVSDSNANQ